MDRVDLIQEIFKTTNFQNYLEIGCQGGKSFLPIKAQKKTAVDPVFKIPVGRRVKWLLKWPANFKARFFEEESDTFFEKRKPYLNELKTLDVVLVDGLHNFRGSLHDVLHSLEYLNQDGIIIMHDCFPPHAAAAIPADVFPSKEQQQQIEGWTGEWCGDVWKSIVYLQKKYPDLLDSGVINTDYGLGYVRFKRDIQERKFSVDEELYKSIDQLTYEDMVKDPKKFINLRPESHCEKILQSYKNR